MDEIIIRTLDGPYTLTPDEARLYRLGLWGSSNVRCGAPLPSLDGTGVCLRCGWQHARRGPGAVERVAQANRRAVRRRRHSHGGGAGLGGSMDDTTA
jgi:hypothetical protein